MAVRLPRGHAASTLWVAPGNAILSADAHAAHATDPLVTVERDTWNPTQYERFRSEREQPFYDLAALITRRPAGRVVDLGCGTGLLTAALHDQWARRKPWASTRRTRCSSALVPLTHRAALCARGHRRLGTRSAI